jgi:hypothetical protein
MASITLVAVVIVLAAGIGVAALVLQPSSSTQTTSSTTSTGTNALPDVNNTTSVLSPNGLRLTLSLPQTTFPQGSGISIDLSLVNTLSMRNNLTEPAGGSEFSLGTCSQLPLGFAIYNGNYGAANLSQGASLNLSWPGAYGCPALFEIGYWSFAPQSDNVTLVSPQPTGSGNATAPRDMWTQAAGTDSEYWGSWSGQAYLYPSVNAFFSPFRPGVYTLVAGDGWGQLTLLHFHVVSGQSLLDCATIASNPAYVRSTVASVGPGPLGLAAYYQPKGVNDTFLLALSASGHSAVTLTFLNYATDWPLQFNPDPAQIQSWQYFTADGTLVYPATIQPGQCSLLRVVIPQNTTQVPLSFEFSDNQTQTVTLIP